MANEHALWRRADFQPAAAPSVGANDPGNIISLQFSILDKSFRDINLGHGDRRHIKFRRAEMFLHK